MEYETVSFEITDRRFAECGRPLPSGGTCTSTRRFAIRKQHIGLWCSESEDAHSHEWLLNKRWARWEDFEDEGDLEGWVPVGTFIDRTKQAREHRPKSWQISAARRSALLVEISRDDTRCMLCDNTWYRGVRNSREALIWLKRAEPRQLYPDVVDAINKMMPKPTRDKPDWFDRLPADLYYEVKRRFELSKLVPDHPFSIALVRAAKKREGRNFTNALQRYAVDALAMPLCDACNLGRGARLFEKPDDLLQRWAKYKFRGDTKMAEQDAEHVLFLRLIHLAYETDLVETLLPANRSGQRREFKA